MKYKSINVQDIPSEVIWVLTLPKLVGSDTYQEYERIVAKYPEYFPWETKYNSIPKEVHEAYFDEKYPDRDKPVVCTNDGRGIYQQIQEKPFIFRKYTPEEISQWFRELETIVFNQKVEAKKKYIKDKTLWNKYYKKYNLKFRE